MTTDLPVPANPPATGIAPMMPYDAAARARQERFAEAARANAEAIGAPPLLERPLGAGRKLRVVCIGAGFSGIHAAIYFPQHVPGIDLQIYERADDVGGVCEWHSWP